MAFVHRGIAHLCSAVTSAAVPTGMGSTLGNKGGVGLYFKIGATRFLVVNAHLAAHQTAEKRRNAEFNRINKIIPTLLEKRGAQFTSTNPSKSFSEAVKVGDDERVTQSSAMTELPVPATVDGALTVPAAPQEATNESHPHPPAITNSASVSALLPSSITPVKTRSIDLNVQHMIPSVETIVDQTGHVVGEVDECYVVEAAQPDNENQPAVTVEAPAVDANAIAIATKEAESGNQATNKPHVPSDETNNTHHLELSNTENAVGSPADPDNSFTPLATSPGGIPASHSNQAMDALADESQPVNENDPGDVNVNNRMDGTAILDVPTNATKTLENSADLVVFMGDLNYRIKGNR